MKRSKLIMLIFFLFVVGCYAALHLNSDVQVQSTPAVIRNSDADDIEEINSNSLINGSSSSLPGLEVRINPKGFSYASLLASLIIDREILRFHLPASKQCFRQLNSCITIENFVISRYRCPQLVSLYPKPTNRLILNIQNLDLEILADISGEIKGILPMKINNTVHTQINQISAMIHFTVNRKLNGSPYFRIVKCDVTLGFTNIFLQDDLLGDIFNSYFRGTATERFRKQFPIKVCQVIRNIVETKINLPLSTIPKVIPLNKLANFARRTINSIKLANYPKFCYMAICKEKMQKNKTINHFWSPASNLLISPTISAFQHRTGDDRLRRSINSVTTTNANTHRINVMPLIDHQLSSRINAETLQRVTLSPISSTSDLHRKMNTSISADPCANCSSSNTSSPIYDPNNFDKFVNTILPGIMLDMNLVKAFATPDYFQIGLRAAFRQKKLMDTPFYPFPMHFPEFHNGNEKQMLEILISDYTINSLLYHLHKNGIITFRIGPETPKLGGLLKTTCTDDDYDDFGDLEFKDDEEFDDEKNSTETFLKRLKRHISSNDNDNNNETKRMTEDEDIFSELGICLGDIMPAIREKYPRKLIHVKIHSKRTPYLTLLAEDNGIARIDLELEVELYIDDSNEKIGSVLINSTIDGNIQIAGNKIFVLITIQSLKLTDVNQTLGLSPDALENLANLSKDFIAQTANKELSKGLTVELMTGKLPYSLIKPQFSIIDHAVHVSTDFNIPASVLGITSSTKCHRLYKV